MTESKGNVDFSRVTSAPISSTTPPVSETTKTLVEMQGFETLLSGITSSTQTLATRNGVLSSEIQDLEQQVRKRAREIHENEVRIEVNNRKHAAITEMVRQMDDAETFRLRALEDYKG